MFPVGLLTNEAYEGTEKLTRQHLRPLWEENAEENFLKVQKTIMELPKFGRNKAGVVIGAGYGVEELVEELSVLIDPKLCLCSFPPCTICTDKSLPLFVKNDIRPDFVVALNTEATDAVKPEVWFKDVGKNTSLILPITAHRSHVRLWEQNDGGDIYWMVPENIDSDLAMKYADRLNVPLINRGSNSGEFAYNMAAFMACNPIVLIGMTYAFRSLFDVLKGQSSQNFEYHHFFVEGKNCYTTLPFMEQRTSFLETARVLSEAGIRTFNCSSGGILYDNYCERANLRETICP